MAIVTLAYSDTSARSKQCHYRRAHLYCVVMLSEKKVTQHLSTQFLGLLLKDKGFAKKGQGRSNPMHISWTFSLSNFPSQNGRVVSQSYCLFVKMSRIERVKSTPHLAGYKSRSHKNWIIYLSPFNSQLSVSAWEWQFAQFVSRTTWSPGAIKMSCKSFSHPIIKRGREM